MASIPCPTCGQPLKASQVAKRNGRLEFVLVCDGPHDADKAATDPRQAHALPRKRRGGRPL